MLSFWLIDNSWNFHNSSIQKFLYVILFQIAVWICLGLYGNVLNKRRRCSDRNNSLSFVLSLLLLPSLALISLSQHSPSKVRWVIFLTESSIFEVGSNTCSRCLFHLQINQLILKWGTQRFICGEIILLASWGLGTLWKRRPMLKFQGFFCSTPKFRRSERARITLRSLPLMGSCSCSEAIQGENWELTAENWWLMSQCSLRDSGGRESSTYR